MANGVFAANRDGSGNGVFEADRESGGPQTYTAALSIATASAVTLDFTATRSGVGEVATSTVVTLARTVFGVGTGSFYSRNIAIATAQALSLVIVKNTLAETLGLLYPITLPIDPADSERVVRDSRQSDISGDGAARVRKLAADKFDFKLHHPLLTAVERALFDGFYAAHKTEAFDFLWPDDGRIYTVVFGPQAYRTKWKSPTRRDFWVSLVGQ